jgi:AraC-like DNA-binding protein
VGASVLSVSSRALVDACARLGLDTAQILGAAKLDQVTLQDPDARVPIEQVAALWRKAYELSGDPDLALHAVEALPFGAYRVVDLLASSAPTVGTAFAKVSDYFPLINDVVRLPYAVGEREVTIQMEAPTHPSVLTRAYTEYTLAAVFVRTRIATREPFPLVRVDVMHPAPADVREHSRVFQCPVRFGADACRLVIARDVWEMPCHGADDMLFSVLDTHARMLLDQRPSASELANRVRGAVETELRGGHPTLESIAKRMAMSPRTLQRRLKDEGIAFNDVVDAMRFQAAKVYLADREIAGTEIAYLLGFAEQSSFNRAFRRWTGQTPTEYRRRLAVT